MQAPATLARIRTELRALPTTNPGWPSDAILLLRDALREAAIYADTAGQRGVAQALQDIADDAQALAPIFAPAIEGRAAQLAHTEAALRLEGSA
jgi:hypothetical protein